MLFLRDARRMTLFPWCLAADMLFAYLRRLVHQEVEPDVEAASRPVLAAPWPVSLGAVFSFDKPARHLSA
jgi:hypothetical protein